MVLKKNDFIKLILRNFKDKIFDLTVELYCKVKNLIFQISLNQLDKIFFFIKPYYVQARGIFHNTLPVEYTD